MSLVVAGNCLSYHQSEFLAINSFGGNSLEGLSLLIQSTEVNKKWSRPDISSQIPLAWRWQNDFYARAQGATCHAWASTGYYNTLAGAVSDASCHPRRLLLGDWAKVEELVSGLSAIAFIHYETSSDLILKRDERFHVFRLPWASLLSRGPSHCNMARAWEWALTAAWLCKTRWACPELSP